MQPTRPLPSGLATALVFVAAGSVLVLEIVALRLVGPYVGVTLQVSSSVIGISLGAIAYGTWLGGRLADRFDPRSLLAPALILAGIGTAVTLYPVLKRQNEGVALGLVGSRVLEGAGILAGVACLLAIVSLRQAGAGADALVTGQTLAILYGRIFLLSQSLMPALNDLLLGFLLYQSRLVPRVLPLLGLIGGPLLLAGFIGTLFNFWGPVSPVTGLLALPVALFELSLGVYLTVKGFKPSPILASATRAAGVTTSRNELEGDH